jgi:hypothetical protein
MNERTLSRSLLVLGALLALAGSRPPPARAEAPATHELMRLDDRLARTRRVRITTPSGWLVAEGVRVSIEGLTYRNVLLTTGGATLPASHRIPWEEVRRVDVPGNHALGAMLVTGAVTGGLAYGALYAAGQQGDDIGGGGAVLYAIPVLTLLAAGVGALIPSWHPIYRRPHAAGSRR